MRDYAELVNALRCCSTIDAQNNGCDSCPYEYCGENCQKLCAYAAGAIEELLAKLDELWIQLHVEGRSLIDDYPHWISVEERLPEFHVNDSGCVCTNTILYRTEYKTVHLGYAIRTAHNIETIDGFEQIVVDRWYDQSGEMIDGVTHWMLLPEPPKGVE